MKYLLSKPPKLIPPWTPSYPTINVFVIHSCPKILRQKTHPDFHPSSPTYLQPPSSQASQVCSFMGVICSSHGEKHDETCVVEKWRAYRLDKCSKHARKRSFSCHWHVCRKIQFGKHQTEFFGHWVIGMITCKFAVLKISASRISTSNYHTRVE